MDLIADIRPLVDNWPASIVVAAMPMLVGPWTTAFYWLVQYAFLFSPSASLAIRTMEFYTLTNIILGLSGQIPLWYVLLPYMSFFFNPLRILVA